MQANKNFENLDLEFWSNIKLLNQRLGYTLRRSKANPTGGFLVPTKSQITEVFMKDNLSVKRLLVKDELTELGKKVVDYMKFRGEIITTEVKNNLMDKKEAKSLFKSIRKELKPRCPLPLNKQTGDKRDYAFLTCIVNMLIENAISGAKCDYNPMELTAITKNGFPVRTMSRRVDGAFPSVIDPIAVWEIKEYYYTTTFGSRVADGVYETQLDGWELWEAKTSLGKRIDHYLIVDDSYTWWELGRSYLCRLIDIMHMGLVTEVLFGKEVIKRIPEIARKWR